MRVFLVAETGPVRPRDKLRAALAEAYGPDPIPPPKVQIGDTVCLPPDFAVRRDEWRVVDVCRDVPPAAWSDAWRWPAAAPAEITALLENGSVRVMVPAHLCEIIRAAPAWAKLTPDEAEAMERKGERPRGLFGLDQTGFRITPEPRATGCGKPWHEQPCRCETGWLREEELEPRLKQVWCTRSASTRSGYIEATPVDERLARLYERVWKADGHPGDPSRFATVLHPTREGAIAAWREAVRRGR